MTSRFVLYPSPDPLQSRVPIRRRGLLKRSWLVPARIGPARIRAAMLGRRVCGVRSHSTIQTQQFASSSPSSRYATLLIGLILSAAFSKIAQAGISPENVFVVVNADADESRTIANHYVDLRDIPTSNVFLLEDVPTGIEIPLEMFKTRILTPVLKEIEKRGLASQVRVIAYSSMFPTAVNVKPHWEKLTDQSLSKVQKPVASLTGLTYFFRMVLADDPRYLSLSSNLYSRGEFRRFFENPFVDDRRTEFEEAKKSLEEGDTTAAAEVFESLFESAPSLPSLAMLSAKAYADAESKDDALRLLKSSIAAGWWNGEYIRGTRSFEPLLNDPQVKGALDYMSDAATDVQGPIGFSSTYFWTSSGERTPDRANGVSYMASCALAVTYNRGSRLDRAVESLRRSSEADRTFPKGEFRFALTSDVRTRTRLPGIANAIVHLAEAGHKADIIRQIVPSDPGDVAGLAIGTPGFELRDRRWNFVPGAIAENLTSYSGHFGTDSQTKFTAFLDAGAAMSSGSVTEPFAIQSKFPLPMMYSYYADGVTAIEAFYLSIHSPYQTLIVGDPLCQPYAKAPNEWIDIDVSNTTPRVIQFTRKPMNLNVPSSLSRLIEIYVEGRLVKQAAPTGTIRMNLPANVSGAAEIRAVLTAIGANETRLWFSEEFDLHGMLATPSLKIVKRREMVEPESKSILDGPIGEPTEDDEPENDSAQVMKFSLSCEGADSIDLTHLNTVLATVNGSSGEVEIDAGSLGAGPLRFRAVAHFGETKVRGLNVIDRPSF